MQRRLEGEVLTIGTLRKVLEAGQGTEEMLRAMDLDERSGVRQLAARYRARKSKEAALAHQYQDMLCYEQEYYGAGHQFIAGVDEAGRGPLAGPLSVAAVILPRGVYIPGLNDSKKLSAREREKLYDEICQHASAITVELLGPKEIDEFNIYEATKLAMADVLLNLNIAPTVALIDAMEIMVPDIEVRSIIKGDALSVSIAAASIIAKVTRDRFMLDVDKEYPEYNFQQHKGYGSREHMEAISTHGATPWHRRSFEPVKSMGIGSEGMGMRKIMRIV